jgi:HlyD family secretion protein
VREAAACLASLLIVILAVATPVRAQPFLGYVETDYVRVSSTAGGRLISLNVERGQPVTQGALIGKLDDAFELAQVQEAQARLAQASAQVVDLEFGRRPPEIDVIEAQKRQAQAQATLSRAQVERQKALLAKGVASREAYDEAVMAFARDEARVKELDGQITVAKLTTGRDQAIAAARAAMQAAQASLAQANWRLNERSLFAGTTGTISDIIYRPGEIVAAGGPVALIISPNYTKARFYISQADLSRFSLGTAVNINCDGCKQPITANVTYIAPDAEFTPPVIYSDTARTKLVFLVEARAAGGNMPIQPGQPISVTISTGPKP